MANKLLISGTLNPALQDKNGRPKRDISTIIHILNDLLCAAPQYRKNGELLRKTAEEAIRSSTQQVPPSKLFFAYLQFVHYHYVDQFCQLNWSWVEG